MSAAGEGPSEPAAAGGAPAGPAPAVGEGGRTLVPRWIQLVTLPLLALAAWALAKAAGKVVLIFVVAAVIALILNPVVAFVQRRRVPRGVAVLVVYVAFFLTVVGIGFLLANPLANQVRVFTNNLPHLTREANETLANVQRELNEAGVHVKFIKQGKTALQTFQDKIAGSAGTITSFSAGVLTEAAGAIFDLVLVFVLSVYMLLYGQRIGAIVRRVMPEGGGEDYPRLVQRAVSRYIGGQLLFSLVMGTTAGLALYLFGVLGIFPPGRTYAVAFGAFLGFMELIPYIGPFLGALPPVLVALFTDPISALWVALLFLGLQQLEGHVVAPQIFGHTLRLNPLLVIFALLVGEHMYGLVGALVALPIVAVLRETIVYLHAHLELEPWERSRGSVL
ncbi:MAG TPA: AI-2E family transporter [Solirubrobacteraceae bacterium]|nr:AI-2E family transporter [Solirubrobacteraceae bacterium]